MLWRSVLHRNTNNDLEYYHPLPALSEYELGRHKNNIARVGEKIRGPSLAQNSWFSSNFVYYVLLYTNNRCRPAQTVLTGTFARELRRSLEYRVEITGLES